MDFDRGFTYESDHGSDIAAHHTPAAAQSDCGCSLRYQSALEWRAAIPGESQDRQRYDAAHHLQRVPGCAAGPAYDGGLRIDSANDRLHALVRPERQSVHYERVLHCRIPHGPFTHSGHYPVSFSCNPTQHVAVNNGIHLRIDDRLVSEDGSVRLEQMRFWFDNPHLLRQPGVMDAVLRGLVTEWAQDMDEWVTEDVTNHLFRE